MGLNEMEIRLISDIHLDGCKDWQLPPMEGEADQVLVIAGDIANGKLESYVTSFFEDVASRFRKVLVVLGNHDYYHADIQDTDANWWNLAKHWDNVTLLQKDIHEIDDVVFIGCTLWTDFDFESEIMMNNAENYMTDYRLTNGSDGMLRATDILKIHKDHMKFIEWATMINYGTGKKLVLVTHHLTVPELVAPRWKYETDSNPLFHGNMDQRLLNMFDIAVCGHTHDSMELYVGTTRCYINPKGYGIENAHGFDPWKVIDV